MSKKNEVLDVDDFEHEPVSVVPWARRYDVMQRLRRELGSHGLTQAFMCAMAEADPEVNVKVSFTKMRKRRAGK
jgi:hypothetical protein